MSQSSDHLYNQDQQEFALDRAKARLRDLIEECRKAQRFSESAVMVYRMPGIYRRDKRSLFGRGGGPLGKVVGTGLRSSMVMFQAAEVLAACEKKLAELEPEAEVTA